MAYDLSYRERQVLKSVIDCFIENANPVGSKEIAQKLDLGLSPATIRNTMANLAASGLLEQPHTSAGRLPTSSGYRVYVNDLMKLKQLFPWEKKLIQEFVAQASPNISDLLHKAAEILGKLSNLLGVVFSSNFEQGILQKIDLSRLSDDKLLVIIAIKLGMVKTIVLEFKYHLEKHQLEDTCRLLNERLAGLPLRKVREEIKHRVQSIPPNTHRGLVTLFVKNADTVFKFDDKSEVFHTGFTTLLDQPEFKQANSVKTVIELIEDKQILIHIVGEVKPEDGVKVVIGEESNYEYSKQLSVISSAFKIGSASGTLNILGPTRMNYPKLFSLVNYTAQTIDKYFNK